jgi:hypothetical protein
MSDEEARPPLNIPSPNELTESDDERQQSAQKPDTSNALNADSDRPVVSAISASEAIKLLIQVRSPVFLGIQFKLWIAMP